MGDEPHPPGASRRAFLRGLAFRAAAARLGDQQAEISQPAPEPPPPSPAERAPSPFTLGDAELERYARQLELPGFNQGSQLRLRDANALVVGLGSIGAPVAAYLVAAGVGRAGLVDDADVAPSDLHRQFLFLDYDVGYFKCHEAVARLGVLNPEVLLEAYQARFDVMNADALLVGQDLVVDCSNDERTHAVVNRACCRAGVPFVIGAAARFGAIALTVRPGRTACWRCAGLELEDEAGRIGPVGGVIGSVMALEALRLLAGLEPELLDSALRADLGTLTFERVPVARDPACPDCGGE